MAYTPGDLLITATMEGSTGLPQDRFVNTFAFQMKDLLAPTAGEVTTLFGVVDQFYNWVSATPDFVGNYISEAVDRGATHELAAYHIVAGPLGSPFQTMPWLGPAAPAVHPNLPTEVAGVLSFHGDLTGVAEESGSTRPKARRRGRIYVGPLTNHAITSDEMPLLSSSFRTILQSSAVKMADDADAAGAWWSVWSREAATLYPVVGGWTDNACDTQRRRGNEATARSTWGPVGP